jgi:hypothetical protein
LIYYIAIPKYTKKKKENDQSIIYRMVCSGTKEGTNETECIKNYIIMKRLMNPYTKLQAITQGTYIQNQISEGTASVITVLKDKLYFNFDYKKIAINIIEEEIELTDQGYLELVAFLNSLTDKTDKII